MMEALMREAVERKASDLHITVGVPPTVRINGSLAKLAYAPLTVQDTAELFTAITSSEQRDRFQEYGELDFSFAISGVSRFRVNAFRQRGSMAMAIRIVNERILTLDELGMPEIVKTMARYPRGLVLVTGPTGSGKSTTLAAMIDQINRERDCHILTLEDPIE